MSDMPERIWTWLLGGQNQISKYEDYANGQADGKATEYLRADLYTSLETASEIISSRMSWTVNDNAKKAIQIADQAKELEALRKAERFCLCNASARMKAALTTTEEQSNEG